MNTLEALGILAGVGIAGYLGYEYISKNPSTSTTSTTGATPSYVPIGQATPYETTGHLEDPLINELLNAVNSLEQQISSQSSPTTSPTYPTYNYYTGGSTGQSGGSNSYPSSVIPSVSPSPSPTPGPSPPPSSSPATVTPSFSVSAAQAAGYTVIPVGQGNYLLYSPSTGMYYDEYGNPVSYTPKYLPGYTPPSKTSTSTTTSTSTSSQFNGGKWYSPVSTTQSVVTQLSNTFNALSNEGSNINTQQSSQIKAYNPYYNPGPATTPSSKIGSAITATVVNALGGTSSKAAQTYLNVTRPIVTTVEAAAHPEIQAFNQAVSTVENVANNVGSAVSSAVSSATKTASSVESAVSSAASNAVKSVSNWFSNFKW